MSQKFALSSLLQRRAVWFVLGVAVLPIVFAAKVIFYPSPQDAMGWVDSYEERFYQDSWLGDHLYELSFSGDRARFEKFAKRLGYAKDQIRPTEYRKADPDGEWSSGVRFDEEAGTGKITFYSESN